MSTKSDDRPADASASNKGAGDGAEGERGRLSAASQRAADAYQAARERTSSAYAAARERAGTAYESAGRRASEGIESNPLAAVAGGLALGAILGALLPRTDQEERLLGPAGRRITDTAREAARAAREAGRQQLDELGLSKEGLKGRLGEFGDRAAGAARNTAGAAAERVKSKQQG
jgi:ElaB/YqjD/DUF883 family membrane-anchored ribosome-binding protein